MTKRTERPAKPPIEPPPEMTNEQCADRLRAAFDARGMKASTAAQKLGWPLARTHEYLNGQRQPGYAKLAAMIDRLGLDVRILFPKKNPQKRTGDA